MLLWLLLLSPPAQDRARAAPDAHGILSKVGLVRAADPDPLRRRLLIALQWAGITYSWSNGRIIALLTLFGVLVLVFVAVEWWVGDDAMVPKRVIKQRSIVASVVFAFTNGGARYLFAYYIPM